MMFTFFSVNHFSRYLLWIIFLLFVFILLFNGGVPFFQWHSSSEFDHVDTSGEIILARLSRAMAELSALKAQNEELRSLIQNYVPFDFKSNSRFVASHGGGDGGRSHLTVNEGQEKTAYTGTGTDDEEVGVSNSQYEFSRRKLKNDIQELWNYIRHHGGNLSTPSGQLFAKEITNSLIYDWEIISQRNEPWRAKKLRQLSNYIQDRLSQLQNPSDCKLAPKLVCNLNKGCGFGCQIHHLVYCTIVAMATSRTLILNSKSWRYVNNPHGTSGKSLWEVAFKPLSNSCLDDYGKSRGNWIADSGHQIQVIDLPIIDSLRPRPKYLPLSIPEEISEQLVMLHGSPIVWFIGQILHFLMRPSLEIEQYLAKKKEKFAFKSPIVGVHVRRTDKIHTEAAYHALSEYMVHVEDYFDRLDLFAQRQNKKGQIERVVYLATDDISVWKKEIKAYEQRGYKFIGDYQISHTASLGRRYSTDSLRNIILDVWLLSETDYLVCTFSSQVCRLAYELMQARSTNSANVKVVDKSADYYSLDDIYYFGGQSDHNQVAVVAHKPPPLRRGEEIALKVGDLVGIAGNHWNGYSKGVNRDTQSSGLYPGFKTVEKIDTAPFELFRD